MGSSEILALGKVETAHPPRRAQILTVPLMHSTAIIYNLLVAIFVAGISAHGGRSTRAYSSTG
jgi:hypothetical protein